VSSSSQARTSSADDSSVHTQVLTQGIKASVDSIQSWQLLSQLQLQNQQYDLAAESAAKGLKCLHQRQKRGYRSQPAIAAGIVLARARSLLHLGLSDVAVAPPLTPPHPPKAGCHPCGRQSCLGPSCLSCFSLVDVAKTQKCWSNCTWKGQGQHINGMFACMVRYCLSGNLPNSDVWSC